jgi:5-methylcytosine-specific restriction endonuclease McrA
MRKSLRIAVWEKYNKFCAYCGTKLEYKKMQVDHFYPQRNPRFAKSYGIDVDSIENLMPSCRRCNHYKGALLPDAFRKRMMTLHKRIADLYIAKVAVDYGIVILTPFDGKFFYEYFSDEFQPPI